MTDLLAGCAERMLISALASLPIKLGSIIGHAILSIVGYIVLMEFTFPVEKVPDEVVGVLKDVLLRPFKAEATRWSFGVGVLR